MRFKVFKSKQRASADSSGEKLAGVPLNELSPRARAALSALSTENAALKKHLEQLFFRTLQWRWMAPSIIAIAHK